MTRRSGMTLVEVLVAIFVMGIGLIALLALFPLGILRIAQAIHEDRCASSFINATGMAQTYNLGNDLDVASELSAPGLALDAAAPLPDLFANPYPRNAGGVAQLPNADAFHASYPIFVDPIGFYRALNTPYQHWVGAGPGFLRRRPAEFTRRAGTLQTNIMRSFTLWDDMSFQNGDPLAGAIPGTPNVLAPTAPPTISRDSRFSWGYVYQRPQTSDPAVVDCSVVVFDKRSLSPSGGVALSEYVYPNAAYFDFNKSTILVDYTGNVPPPIRPGNWLLDSTLYQTNPAGPTPYRQMTDNVTPGSAHAFFYRVVAADDLVVAGRQIARYEVQQPIRGFMNPATGTPLFATVNDPTDASATPRQVFAGTVIVIEGIAEVFEKGPMRLP